MKKLPRTYFIMPNGIKIDTRCAFSLFYLNKELVSVTVKEPRADMALTDELRSKGSIEVTFNYDEFKEILEDK